MLGVSDFFREDVLIYSAEYLCRMLGLGLPQNLVWSKQPLILFN